MAWILAEADRNQTPAIVWLWWLPWLPGSFPFKGEQAKPGTLKPDTRMALKRRPESLPVKAHRGVPQ